MPALVHDAYLYSFADKEFYEPLDRYQPNRSDFIEVAERMLPAEGWGFARHGIWYNCAPLDAVITPQGWKIHVSATPGNSGPILATVARRLGQLGVPFKFAMDKTMLYHLVSKRWARGGAGKFITVYPSTTEQAGELLEILRRDLVGYSGPYILSDRRYRDSKTVYYRYGGMLAQFKRDVNGNAVAVIEASDGSLVADERTPYFNLPEGMEDPFAGAEAEDEGGDGTLNNGRYRVESVLSFSSPGGVYLATDLHTGDTVVIKEARPHTNVSPKGADAVWLLKKEHRLLELVEGMGLAPRPIEYFVEWEHHFLVEEYLTGRNLRQYMAQHGIGLRIFPTLEDSQTGFERFRNVHIQAARALQKMHDMGIVFSDVSQYNILVLDEEGNDIRFIDFEGAYQPDIDIPPSLYTPGFAPAQMVAEGYATREDDRYGLGGLMLAALIPVNELAGLDAEAHGRFLRAWVRDFGFPDSVTECIRGLMSRERRDRWSIPRVVEALERSEPVQPPHIRGSDADDEALYALARETMAYVESVADFSREDRLFPASPGVHQTNPLNLAYGACGVASALLAVNGAVPERVSDWIRARRVTPDAYAPGLYVGAAGVAWSLLEMGFREDAERVMRSTENHPLLWQSPDLFEGAAGWGMAQLRFFMETGDERYLDQARAAGAYLARSARESEAGCWWQAGDEEFAGLGHGGAGVSLFLLYLSLATGDESPLELGRRGMDHVLWRGMPQQDGGLTWRVSEDQPTHTPYYRWGSAGVGMSLLRYNRVVEDARYAEAIEGIAVDCDRKYSIFSGRLLGLAGVGEFFLDLAELGGDPARARAGARKVLAGVELFGMKRPGGIAFPGETRSRISCDLATGGAGVALFVHRMAARTPAPFMLDELLQTAGAAPAGAARVRRELGF